MTSSQTTPILVGRKIFDNGRELNVKHIDTYTSKEMLTDMSMCQVVINGKNFYYHFTRSGKYSHTSEPLFN